jgi:hypothetical protein
MSIKYEPLVDIRRSVPVGQRTLFPAERDVVVELRDVQSGDLEHFLGDLNMRIEDELLAPEDPGYILAGASSDVAPNKIQCTAEKAKEQLVGMLGKGVADSQSVEQTTHDDAQPEEEEKVL